MDPSALAETLEGSDYTSVQRRIQSPGCHASPESTPDQFLRHLRLTSNDTLWGGGQWLWWRASDKDFADERRQYITLLD
jgi:hypothetical protein